MSRTVIEIEAALQDLDTKRALLLEEMAATRTREARLKHVATNITDACQIRLLAGGLGAWSAAHADVLRILRKAGVSNA